MFVTDKAFNPMQFALLQAEIAGKNGEIPVGAVIFDAKENKIVASAGNRVEETKNPLNHAEILVINEACRKLGSKTLDNLDIYVTLEPCPLCASAISLVRLKRLYFGAYDPKSGGVLHGPKIFQSSSCHHIPEIYSGIEEMKCSEIIRNFFTEIRMIK
ncbi:MAG: nucleoside deaminase [Alphaproteobacteria bacterium]